MKTIERPVVIPANDLHSRGVSSDEHGIYEYVRLSGTIDAVAGVPVFSHRSTKPITSAYLELRRGGSQLPVSIVSFVVGEHDGTGSSVEAFIIAPEHTVDACWNGNFETVIASLQFVKPIGEGEGTDAGFWPTHRDTRGDIDLGAQVTERQVTGFRIRMT